MSHWSLFFIKLGISTLVGGGVAWGISFSVADYVVKASVSGLTLSVQNLQASLDTLSATVRQVDQDIKVEVRRLNDDRTDLASAIAREVADIQVKNGEQSVEIRAVAASLARIESSLSQIQTSLPINYMVNDKGVISVDKWQEIRTKYGVSDETPVLVVPSGKEPAPQ